MSNLEDFNFADDKSILYHDTRLGNSYFLDRLSEAVAKRVMERPDATEINHSRNKG